MRSQIQGKGQVGFFSEIVFLNQRFWIFLNPCIKAIYIFGNFSSPLVVKSSILFAQEMQIQSWNAKLWHILLGRGTFQHALPLKMIDIDPIQLHRECWLDTTHKSDLSNGQLCFCFDTTSIFGQIIILCKFGFLNFFASLSKYSLLFCVREGSVTLPTHRNLCTVYAYYFAYDDNFLKIFFTFIWSSTETAMATLSESTT